jgi:hypothetical protein
MLMVLVMMVSCKDGCLLEYIDLRINCFDNSILLFVELFLFFKLLYLDYNRVKELIGLRD